MHVGHPACAAATPATTCRARPAAPVRLALVDGAGRARVGTCAAALASLLRSRPCRRAPAGLAGACAAALALLGCWPARRRSGLARAGRRLARRLAALAPCVTAGGERGRGCAIGVAFDRPGLALAARLHASAVLVSARGALWLAGGCAALVAGHGAGRARRLAARRSPTPAARRCRCALATQWLLLGRRRWRSACCCRALGRALRAARSARAALSRPAGASPPTAYWEIDEQFRFTHLSGTRRWRLGRRCRAAARPGALGDRRASASTTPALDAHRADLEAHQPFRDLPLQLARPRRHAPLVWSAAGRASTRAGVFLGYWGVAATSPPRCSRSRRCAATEARYRELFARSPTPLVLHRDGRVLDANPAALAPVRLRRRRRRMIGQRPARLLRRRRGSRAARRRRAQALRDAAGRRGAAGAASSVLRAARRPAHRGAAPPASRVDADGGAGGAVDLRRRHRAPAGRGRACAAPRRCCRTWWPPAPT